MCSALRCVSSLLYVITQLHGTTAKAALICRVRCNVTQRRPALVAQMACATKPFGCAVQKQQPQQPDLHDLYDQPDPYAADPVKKPAPQHVVVENGHAHRQSNGAAKTYAPQPPRALDTPTAGANIRLNRHEAQHEQEANHLHKDPIHQESQSCTQVIRTYGRERAAAGTGSQVSGRQDPGKRWLWRLCRCVSVPPQTCALSHFTPAPCTAHSASLPALHSRAAVVTSPCAGFATRRAMPLPHAGDAAHAAEVCAEGAHLAKGVPARQDRKHPRLPAPQRGLRSQRYMRHSSIVGNVLGGTYDVCTQRQEKCLTSAQASSTASGRRSTT